MKDVHWDFLASVSLLALTRVPEVPALSLASVYILTKPGKNIFAGEVELEEALCFFRARN